MKFRIDTFLTETFVGKKFVKRDFWNEDEDKDYIGKTIVKAYLSINDDHDPIIVICFEDDELDDFWIYDNEQIEVE